MKAKLLAIGLIVALFPVLVLAQGQNFPGSSSSSASGLPVGVINPTAASTLCPGCTAKADLQFDFTATITNGSNAVTTAAGAPAFTSADNVKERRQPQPGLVHHSDRGLQYARAEYITILEKYHMVPSMSRPANPYDNASCESFMKTLKREEIYANKYDDLEHLRANIQEFIDQYYNRQRLHSALGYRSPEEFEQKTTSQAESRSATMEFFENKENNKKNSKGLLGKGTQMPSPSPDPFSC